MINVKIDNEEINVDISQVMKDVYESDNPVSTKMVEKRINAGRPDRALKMAYAGLTKGKNGLPTMSYLEFARKYEVVK